LLEAEDAEGDDGRDQPGGEEGDAEDQVQAEGGADELGEVGCHGHDLGLDPQHHVCGLAEGLSAQFGQALAGGDRRLRGQVLDQDGHQVGHHDHPDELVSVTGTGGEVGREVAGIDVGDRGDEGGPQDRGAAPETALGQDVLEFAGRTADRRRVGQHVFYRDLVLLAGHQLAGYGLKLR